MANSEHVEIVRKGSDAITRFRFDNPRVILDLSHAYLFDADLTDADLSGAEMTGAHPPNVDLSNAELTGANLTRSNLFGAILSSAKLTRANLSGANLTGAYLPCADLSGANLSGVNLRGANLTDANLTGANLFRADLPGAFLSGADLTLADLSQTIFNSARIDNTVFNLATLGYGVFVGTDFSTAIGLDSVVHDAPTSIGVDSIFQSNGKIPEVFLRGCGVPEELITYLPSLIGNPFEFYSCFISYSHQDEEFCKRLHSRMQQEKLRVWYAPEDLKRGRKIHEQIDSAIRVHDKLLLVLSEHSMKSDWVSTEIYRAIKREKQEGKRVLFPIRLCSFDAIKDWTLLTDQAKDLAVEIREYFIPDDFSNWKDHDAFETGFSKLLRDLRAAGN